MFYRTSKTAKKPEILNTSSYDASIKRHLITSKYCIRVESVDACGRNHFFGVYTALSDAVEMQRRIEGSWKNEATRLILHSLFLYTEPNVSGRNPDELVRIEMRDIGDPADLPDMRAIIIKADGVYLEGHKATYDFQHKVMVSTGDYGSVCQSIVKNPVKAAFDLFDIVAAESKQDEKAIQYVPRMQTAA